MINSVFKNSNRKHFRTAFLAGAVLLAQTAVAAPVVVVDATFRESIACGGPVSGVDVPQIPQDLACDLTYSATDGSGAFQAVGRVSTEGGPRPKIDIELDMDSSFADGLNFSSASARIDYAFTVDAKPGAPDVAVPLVISSKGEITGEYGSAELAVSSVFINLGSISPVNNTGTFTDGFNAVSRPTVQPGQVYNTIMLATGSIHVDRRPTSPNRNTHAFLELQADPEILIDPAFEYRDFFSLRFSENLCDTSDCSAVVPTPPAGMLLVTALAAVAARVRRRRHTPPTCQD